MHLGLFFFGELWGLFHNHYMTV